MSAKLKLAAFLMFTWLIFILFSWSAYFYVRVTVPTYSFNDAQSVIWAWASLIMGFYLTAALKRWFEIIWGTALFVSCLFPVVGVFIGMLYFLRGYKLLLSKETK